MYSDMKNKTAARGATVSPAQVVDRILEWLELFPELLTNLPATAGTKAFWRRAFAANAAAGRMLQVLQEAPAFTELAPTKGDKAAWLRLLDLGYGFQAESLLRDIVRVAGQKPAARKKVLRWRDRYGPNEVIQRVRPEETDEYLHNPHRGTTTFQRFQGDAPYPLYFTSDTHGPLKFDPSAPVGDNLKYPPRTTLTYCRWPWAWLEPAKGKFNWSIIDQALAVARRRGQTLQARFQPYTARVEYSQHPSKSRRHPPERSVNLPDWYWDTGAGWIAKGPYAQHEPDSNDPKYLKHFGDFIRAFAARYDGHEDLESVDMAYAGFWGESGGNATVRTGQRLTDIYLRVFRKTQLVSMLGTPGCGHAQANAKRPIGWRADCFGDLRRPITPDVPPESCFNHTYDNYPRTIEQCGVKDAWMSAPVTMETCGNVASWYLAGYDLERIMAEGYKYHMSVFMPKNVFYPEPFRARLAEFDKHIGYRFVLRQLMLPLECQVGKTVKMSLFVDNVGCAPIYRPYPLAVRFRQGKRQFVVHFREDVRRWRPGNSWFEETVRVPEGLRKGEVKIDLAIVDPADKAKVFFATAGRLDDGWTAMTSMEVV